MRIKERIQEENVARGRSRQNKMKRKIKEERKSILNQLFNGFVSTILGELVDNERSPKIRQ